MKRTIYAALAATVALPMLAVPAAAQQDRGYGYGQSGETGYTDDRGYGPRYSDHDGRDRGWQDGRGFDPYAHQGWGPPQDDRMRARMHDEMSARMHDEMRARHHGYRDRDFRRDLAEDGRRGYHQDSRYEEMPRGKRRMGPRGGAERADMRELRRAMRMIDRFDVDEDGRVTQEEVDQYRSDRLSQFDTDGDQQLTVDEYAELWADAMRERMVRRFQRHDRDGDGRITVAEFSRQSGDIVRMHDRNRDDALSEEDFMRPRVEAPMGGSPNQPAESRAVGDDNRSDYDTRPEVEAPIEGTPNEPAGAAAEDDEDEDTTND
ncbi:MAG TPA: hypothetical protein VMM55_09595 [Thermohalobaculum sp.]|nr:hypothetical protein [Thermohalobaculum sp.]